jgi:hypothetical protein
MEEMRKPNVFIRSDRETIEGLKKIAGKQPVAAYLRGLASGSPPPASTMEKRLTQIEEWLACAYKDIAYLGKSFDIQTKNISTMADSIATILEYIKEAKQESKTG